MSHDVGPTIEYMRSLLGGDKAIYVSCPIMSGRLSYTNPGAQELPNRVAGRVAGSRLRHAGLTTLIEPARAGKIQGWSRDDYLRFWFAAIDEFADAAVFVSGWEYSSGCAAEYLYCYRRGIATCDELLEEISLESAIKVIEDACLDIEFIGHKPSDGLVSVLESLRTEASELDEPIPYVVLEGP